MGTGHWWIASGLEWAPGEVGCGAEEPGRGRRRDRWRRGTHPRGIGQFAGELIGGAGLGFFAGVVGKGEAAQGHAIFNECGRRAANRAKRGHGWLQKVRFKLLIKSRPFEAQGKPALQKEKPRRKRGAILNDRIIWDELYDCQMKNWEEPGGAAHKRGRNRRRAVWRGTSQNPQPPQIHPERK